MTEHEWEEYQRKVAARLEYETYYAPMWINKVSQAFATSVVALVVIAIIWIIVKVLVSILGMIF